MFLNLALSIYMYSFEDSCSEYLVCLCNLYHKNTYDLGKLIRLLEVSFFNSILRYSESLILFNVTCFFPDDLCLQLSQRL